MKRERSECCPEGLSSTSLDDPSLHERKASLLSLTTSRDKEDGGTTTEVRTTQNTFRASPLPLGSLEPQLSVKAELQLPEIGTVPSNTENGPVHISTRMQTHGIGSLIRST